VKILSFIAKKTYKILAREILKRGFKVQKFEGLNERLVEYNFLFDVLNRTSCEVKTILDVGTGTSPLPAILKLIGYEVSAIDNTKDYWKKKPINNHYYIINDDITNTKLDKKFDMITCISTLEHIEDYMSAIKNMWKLLKICGSLVMTFPYNRIIYFKNIYDVVKMEIQPNFICQLFSEAQLKEMSENRFNRINEERWKCFSGNYWRMGDRLKRPVREPLAMEPDLVCLWWKK
jgi:SAM-dependent methyltransferase